MVEEIRSYLLNSFRYASEVYISEDYQTVSLNKLFLQFREAILGPDNLTDPKQQIYRANFLVEQIYKHRYLSQIALDLFDNRTIKDTTFINSSFDPEILINSNNPNLLINAIPNAVLETEVVNQNITLSGTGTVNRIACEIITSFYTQSNNLDFEFSDNLSSFIDIKRTPLRVAFQGVSSVPLNFTKVFIDIKYPYHFDFSSAIQRVNQVSGVDILLFGNKKARESLLDMYTSFVRPHERLLALVLGYATSLKYK